MKTILSSNKLALATILFMMGTIIAKGQSPEEILKKRAEEMYEVLKCSDENNWKNYIKSNYSKKMLEKYELSRHVAMFKNLNRNFTKSKLNSIEIKNQEVLMLIERTTDKHLVTFELNYDKEDDFKFNGISIEAGEL
ncbi:hypothetical protein K8352_03350 [Flavobacteriaceae bacterium F89]|uniref:DUF3887 domain-containing protein n=1 Tax=Cerina litoralis TaxID=2874477 RepID=A0AAE3ERV0_9FLAO|nr:hypothetical protein [Cerina litoralis]MCG2459773.1 hypothetical protein [Cerina litoralis]